MLLNAAGRPLDERRDIALVDPAGRPVLRLVPRPDFAGLRVVRHWALDPPPGAQELLTRLGHTNVYGEPNLRIVWSNARVGWRFGVFPTFDGDGRVVRKSAMFRRDLLYPWVLDRWVIEAFHPAEYFGGFDEWYDREARIVDVRGSKFRVVPMGPYPRRGDYLLFDVVTEFQEETPEYSFGRFWESIATAKHQYLAPTEVYLEWVVAKWRLARELAERRKRLKHYETPEKMEKRENEEREAAVERLGAQYGERIRDACKAFGGRPFVVKGEAEAK